ncbi:MAG: DUF11 domain-containing protein, partial [Patescibacteria group bacterium]
MSRSFPKIYLIAGILISAGFLFLNAKPALAVNCPTEGNNVTISESCNFSLGFTYVFTGTLTIPMDVIVSAPFNSELAPPVEIQADSIVVNGSINTDGKGFPAGQGTGAGGADSGGSFGGLGGGAAAGITYGNAASPNRLGSGGASGAGGGSFKLVAGSITVNGSITANGESVFTPATGAGSGGSIWIVSTGAFAGSGSLTANGGNATAGGAGGGGRIAITAATYSFSGTVTSAAGASDGNAGTFVLDIPTPTITALTPHSATQGTTPGTIVIDGTNFESGAVSKLNGTSMGTAWISPLQMEMTSVPTFETSGVQNITVYNPLSNKTSDSFNFNVISPNNPVPVLDGMTPSTKATNDTDLTVQLSGSNFMATSQVFVDGGERSFAFVNSGSLTVTLHTSDLLTPGTKVVTVVNPVPGGGTSGGSNLTVYVSGGSGGGGGGGAGAGSPTTSPITSSLIPLAGYGKALSQNSIRWYYSSKLANITGFRLENAADNSVLATTTDVAVRYLDETGLNASTTYCNRQIRAVSDAGLSPLETASLFPCATTQQIPMATSTEFTVSPISILNLGIEDVSLGWTDQSVKLGQGKMYGFYLPSENSWVIPSSTQPASISPTHFQGSDATEYKLGSKAYFKSIEAWGSSFKILGLESDTPYRLSIVGSNDSGISGNTVWQFTATTSKGEMKFEGGMELISTSTSIIPTASTTLGVIGNTAGRAFPSLGSLAAVGMLAFVVKHRKHGLKNCLKGLAKVVTCPKPKESLKAVTAKKQVKKVDALHKGLHHVTMVALWLAVGAAILKVSVISVGIVSAPLVVYGAGGQQVTVMTYQLNFKNTGTKTAKNVNIIDPIPAGTVYYPGSLQVDGANQTDAQDTDNAWYSSNPAEAHFHWDSVAPGAAHTMKLSIYLQSGKTVEQVDNTAYMTPPDNADPNTLPFYINEQSICGNSKIEIVRDAQGKAVMSNGKIVWEACDDGANNGKGYGWCNSSCSGVDLPPTNLCGNSKIDSWVNLKTGQTYKETCDEGALNGQPGHCNAQCDGKVALPPKKPVPPKEPEKVPEVIEPTAPSGSATTTPVAATTTAPVLEATTTVIILPQFTTTTVIAETPTTLSSISESVTKGVSRVANVLSAPAVESTVIPTIGLLAVLNIASSASWVTLFNYLYYIFTQPIMLFSKRKRAKYGTIYNSLTKLPVDLAAIRLKDSSGRIIQTKVTDRQGRYTFLANKGQFSLDISKTGYVFPTSLLVGKAMDVDYADLLTANKIILPAPSAISKNIPLDPKEDKRLPGQIKRRMVLRDVQGTVAG